MLAEELRQVLDAHREWLRDSSKGKRANLRTANLRTADLSGADLRGADLNGADLGDANLMGANLTGANLWGANLRGADLGDANLMGASLCGANLTGANLTGASLENATGIVFQIPQTGPLWVYKKLRDGVVMLIVPADAKRTATPVGRKCRAEFAVMGDALGCTDGRSRHDDQFVYPLTPGAVIRPDKYDPDWRVECSNGIHFFLTREEAEAF